MSIIRQTIGEIAKVTAEYAVQPLSEPPQFAHRPTKLTLVLYEEGPYANDETEAFLFQCMLAIQLMDNFTIEEQHELVRLANIHLKPNPYAVRFPEYSKIEREAGVVIVGPISNRERKPWSR